MSRLEEKLERGWTHEDLQSKHIDEVIRGCTGRGDATIKEAIALLCECAEAANDIVLWIRTVRSCGALQRIDRLSTPEWLNGVDLFGLEDLRPV